MPVIPALGQLRQENLSQFQGQCLLQRVKGQPELHSETLSQKMKEKKKCPLDARCVSFHAVQQPVSDLGAPENIRLFSVSLAWDLVVCLGSRELAGWVLAGLPGFWSSGLSSKLTWRTEFSSLWSQDQGPQFLAGCQLRPLSTWQLISSSQGENFSPSLCEGFLPD